MVNGLLGKKLGMTQVFLDDGRVVPVTVIQLGPCNVMQIKTEETDGYSAVQIGFLDKKRKSATNPAIGHAKKASIEPKRFMKEVSSDSISEIKLGQELTVDIFKEESTVDVTGITIGKGFAGVMKRWGFSGGPATHGSNCHRIAGSVGAGTNPGRVIKGRKMSGRMGGKNKSILNLDVVKIDKDKNLMMVKGAIPGCDGGCVVVRKSRSVNT
ncbi:MAG: 50S ribosomal protein L3 [Candidatus Anammoxibacter sp.]